MDTVTSLKTLLAVPAEQRVPMTRSEADVFLKTTMIQTSGRDNVGSASDLLPIFGERGQVPAQVVIMLSRLSLTEPGTKYSFATILFLAYLSQTPGRAVMWAHYLATRTYELGNIVDNDVIARDFPWGLPSDDGALAIWDAQKTCSGNGLDKACAWRRAA